MHEIDKNVQLLVIVCMRSQSLNRSKVINPDRMRTVATICLPVCGAVWMGFFETLTPVFCSIACDS
jgi:hypothetical protein